MEAIQETRIQVHHQTYGMENSEIINATTQLSTLRSKPENRWHSNETAASIEVCCRILDEFQRRIRKEAGRKTIRLQERSRGFGRSLGGLCEEMVITNDEMINHIQAFMQHSFEAALNQRCKFPVAHGFAGYKG